MKRDFWDYLFIKMEENPDIYIISVGLGWPRTDEAAKRFPDRYIQTEASEQTACDIAVGLAYSGKIPFVYTITPFLLRGFETIRTYINHEKLHVILIGAGRNDDYSKDDGYSHDAADITKILDTQDNIRQFYPVNEDGLENNINMAIEDPKPAFISLTR